MPATCVARWRDASSTESLVKLQEMLLNTYAGELGPRYFAQIKLYRDSDLVARARKEKEMIERIRAQHIKNLPPATAETGHHKGPKLSSAQQKLVTEVTRHKDSYLYEMFLSHYSPDKTFAWSTTSLVESGTNMDILIERLKNIWTQRQTCNIEGITIIVGDFIIRAGNITVGTVYKGILLEIEYTACNLPNVGMQLCQDFINEAFSHFNGDVCPDVYFLPPFNWKTTGLSTKYHSSLHLGHQYKLIFSKELLL